MDIPLLDLKAQLRSIKEPLKRAVDGVISSCRFIGGPEVEGLEQAVAEYSGATAAIGVSSGTDALLVSLMGLDVGPGDLVITTPYSFFATAGAIARLGATPVFVDIDPDSYNLCPKALETFVAEKGLDDVKAIIPVHLYGQCADMAPIVEIAESAGVAVIEDAAQAIGSSYRSLDGQVNRAGALGTLACFSFFPSKNLGGLGDGGMVVTSDEELAVKIRKLRNHGGHPKYYHQMIGGNFRLDAIQAAALRVKLTYLEDWHRRRQENAARYDDMLAGIDGVARPKVMQDRAFHIYNQYVLSVPRRDELRAHLAKEGIGSEVYYPVPFHMQECFEYLGYKAGDFPESERAANNTVAIPIYPELTVEMQQRVADVVRAFYA